MLARTARLRCVALLTLLAAAAACRSQRAGSSDSPSFDDPDDGAVALVGPWEFHIGDDPQWASPSFDDSGWETISGARSWGQQGHARYTGFAWYRMHFRFRAASPSPRHLLVPRIHDVYEIFWNGMLVGRDGKMPPKPTWHVSEQPQTFELGSPQDSVLAVRVWKAPLFSDDSGELGGFGRAPIIGGAEAIAGARAVLNYEWLHSRQLQFAEQLIYGLIALLSLLVWWRGRGQWLVLWMACYAVTPVLRVLLLDAHLGLPYSVAIGLAQAVNSIHDASLWLLLTWLLHLNEDRSVYRFVKTLSVLNLSLCSLDGMLLAVATQSKWLVPAQAIDAAIAAVSTIIQFLPVALVIIAIRRRSHLQPASWIVAALTFIDGMFIAVQQALKQGQQFTGWTVGDKLADPLFRIRGNSVSPAMMFAGLLLLAIVAAVYISYREERKNEMLLANEFSNARELQRMLIPADQHSVPGFTISSSYLPALQVGGDFFQVISLQNDQNASTLLLLGDVSGHGLKAALSVSYVIGMVRVLAELFFDPGPLLTEMNRRLCGRIENGFVTCIAVRIDRFGSCTLSSAGHPPPFLNWDPLDVPGALPLGLDLMARYDQITLHLNPCDHLALYTDGLFEARNKAGELYGFERLQRLFAANPTAPEAAEEAVRFGQDDDVTVVTLTYAGVSERVLDASELRTASARSG